MAKVKRGLKRAVLWTCIPICAGLIILAVLCPFGSKWLWLINAFNPMQLTFLESFYVVNSTGEAVEIMPIGMIAVSGEYGPLPRYRDAFPPAVPIPISQPISLTPGAKRKLTYDYDDINFRHILVRDKTGSIYILETDKKGTKHACFGPQKDLYTIPPVERLESAPEELIQCFCGNYVPYTDAKEYPEKLTKEQISE